jgi:aminoglycoside phosphotransferase (APT) family kinase protein
MSLATGERSERRRDGVLVRRIVRDHLGAAVGRVRRMPYGHSSRVYDVALAGVPLPGRSGGGQDGGRSGVIVRLNPHPRVFLGTAQTIAALGRLGLPVPRLLAADSTLTRYPLAFLLLRKVSGRDLGFALPGMTVAQMESVAAGVVAIQRRVSALPAGRGYGFVPLGQPGAHSTWEALIERDAALALAGAAGAIDPALERDLRAALDRQGPALRAQPAVCFLDDLTTKNVIVHRGRLNGIVDLDVVCYGDPLYWLSLTRTAVRADVGPPGEPYLDALDRGWPEAGAAAPRLALYGAIHGLDFLGRAHRSGDATAVARLLPVVVTALAAAR